MNEAYHLDENSAVAEALDALPKINPAAQAAAFIETARKAKKKTGGLDSFLQEFGLTTKEGVALMCLAEALLRIPDTETADLLIRDKIGNADWGKHFGLGADLFSNASAWALSFTGKVIGDVSSEGKSLLSRVSEPVVRRALLQAMKLMGEQFVMGRTIEEALKRAAEEKNYRHSFDMLGEGARAAEDAERYFRSYESAIDAIGKAAAGRGVHDAPGISVKLSALHPRFEWSQKDRCVPMLTEKLLILAQKCAHYDIGLTVDAEEANRLELSFEIIRNVFSDTSLKNWEGFGLALQAYQKRSLRALDYLIDLAEENKRRLMVRLVKGAYWDGEVKYAQTGGLPDYPVFTRKASTDIAYLAAAGKMMARRDVLYPMFATHNAYTVAAVMELSEGKGGFEFQRLHGMGDALYTQIVPEHPCRVYAPVGSHQDLLPYLVRRLLENGANTNFVHQLQSEKVPVAEMIADPSAHIAPLAQKQHPKIPLPQHIFSTRKNSMGVEFAAPAGAILLEEIAAFADKTYGNGKGEKVLSPVDHSRVVGTVPAVDVEKALASAHKAFPAWNAKAPGDRAVCLERMADLLEEHRAELMSLCLREAGKTLPDARDEVREAVDFCRYYAVEGRKNFAPHALPGPTGESNTLQLEGRGVFLCISPWNFPLAIFLGQVAAALMAGNTVIAKPSGQTPLIASFAVDLLHKAGVPKDAVHFLPCSGREAGEKLVPDARIAGVCFTGSTEVAQTINRTLANRPGAIVPLIAETGGQNPMIADSSALPEQIVDDVITSAFRSAGQRCSALRVLFVQEDIADKVIHMLKGACAELRMGDGAYLSTDIGPVIDAPSRAVLEAHAARMDREAKLICRVEGTPEHGTFFAPCAYEISSLAQLTREVFGPILHVIRYKDIDDAIDQINSSGYGLTFGLHTRIDHRMADICARVKAGNAYVNRTMIGAVVGVQPFGGQGLSGTGPKAGGPHYLPRFATEKTISINTTASGGNASLVSLSE